VRCSSSWGFASLPKSFSCVVARYAAGPMRGQFVDAVIRVRAATARGVLAPPNLAWAGGGEVLDRSGHVGLHGPGRLLQDVAVKCSTDPVTSVSTVRDDSSKTRRTLDDIPETLRQTESSPGSCLYGSRHATFISPGGTGEHKGTLLSSRREPSTTPATKPGAAHLVDDLLRRPFQS
jgi:hypothetical protein